MKEALIRQKAISILEGKNYVCWYPPKVKWRKEGDIWGIGDLICTSENGIKLIQLTTLSNLSARRKKIKKALENINVSCLIEVWAYDKKKKQFKVERQN